MNAMRQYEMTEWSVRGAEPVGSWVETDVCAQVTCGDVTQVLPGFYAGAGTYQVRYIPEQPGMIQVKITGSSLAQDLDFTEECTPAACGQHGIVRADGTHFRHADGAWFYPFGTTVYALSHQDDALIEQTFATLAEAPFNKIRMCVFPKHYDYNHNEPPCFAFAKKEDGSWDVHHPNPVFWERLESHITRLGAMGIQVDLILFHPYDRWGFSKLSREEALVYLDYAVKRLAAYPNLWWSLANEYDLLDYEKEDWECFAQFIHDHDPYGHLLSNHHMVIPWDFANANTTHICLQTSDIQELSRQITKYGKPLMVDEMCYEGNLTQHWGNISGRELVRRFWIVCAQGGYATHGETYWTPANIIWWATGGVLIGEAPARIRFLREILESVGGPLTFASRDMDEEQFYAMRAGMPKDAAKGNPVLKLMLTAPWEQAKGLVLGGRELLGAYEEQVYLKYYDRQCTRTGTMSLPETGSYTVEVIDTWEMTRTTVLTGASGNVEFALPGKEGIAVLAKKNETACE